ncbi:MAG TPA: Gfo/Idh/MocA family oxidoreductase [Planctomycetaceae bacterium]|nr:Gfo/Idh/MocA family oxidoreductase [Planctomycetaceae bacterium]
MSALSFQAIAFANQSPNERIRVGVMGTSRNSIGGDGRGTHLAAQFAQQENTEVVYVCDVDSRNVGKAIEAVSKHQTKPPAGVGDFRRILDDQSVDVLVIAAPDHWHGPATILGCNAGKHVYVEKPCCHNPAEGELMVEAANKHKRHVQVGTQRRSWPAIREAIQRLHDGEIGDIRCAQAYYYNNRPSIGHGKPVPVPEWLDWDLWQGPAPRTPYRDNIVHYNWHWFWNWGTAELGNNGVHTLDVCRWGMGADYPYNVSCGGDNDELDDDRETPTSTLANFSFSNWTSIYWHGYSCEPRTKGDREEDICFIGSKADLKIQGGTYTIIDRDGKQLDKKSGRGGDMDHIKNLIDTIRGNDKLNCPIEEGYKSTLLCHLGNIAYRLKKEIFCLDPKTGKISHDSYRSEGSATPQEVQKLWSREYEPGWEPKVG